MSEEQPKKNHSNNYYISIAIFSLIVAIGVMVLNTYQDHIKIQELNATLTNQEKINSNIYEAIMQLADNDKQLYNMTLRGNNP